MDARDEQLQPGVAPNRVCIRIQLKGHHAIREIRDRKPRNITFSVTGIPSQVRAHSVGMHDRDPNMLEINSRICRLK
jgi:hypothetical protein